MVSPPCIPKAPGLRLLYQDGHYVAVDKPAGLMVHRSRLSSDGQFVLQRLRDQIGRHFKHVFRPLGGDTTYGEGRHNRLFRERLGVGRLMLMALQLGFTHPITGEAVRIETELGEDWQRVAQAFG